MKILLLIVLGIGFSSCNQGNVGEETTYFSDKNVLDTKLTGLNPVNTPIAATDSLVTAFSKTQGQLNNKETFITAGTTLQYLAGDKSFKTLNTSNVTEGTNLYLSTSRVLDVSLTGVVTTNATPIAATNTLLEAFGKIQAQLNNKLDSTTFIDWQIAGTETIEPTRLSLGIANANKLITTDGTGALDASTITDTENGYLSGVTSNIQTQLNGKQATISTTTTLPVKSLRIYGANGANYTEVSAPVGLVSNLSFILPSTSGTSDQVLKTDGAGTLSWASVSGLVPVTSVNGSPGAVSLTTTSIGEGTNLYFTANRVETAAPGTLLTALPAGTNSAVAATDTVLTAFANLQQHSTELLANKISLTGGTLSSGTITGVPTPSSNNQVATKQYVDSFVSTLTCPTGFILVPKNTTYVNKDFCVMKYEASDDGYGTAVSTQGGTPWVSINRATARAHCQALGYGYDMISNDQWQTIARNIASVGDNWDSGTVASGQINTGHSDDNPTTILATAADNDPCNGTGQTCSTTPITGWDLQKRTHVLSNGNIIWDLAGNVYEWVTNDHTAVLGADGYVASISDVTNTGGLRQTQYGPLGSTLCSTPGVANNYCGMGYGWFNDNAGAILRGGSEGNVESGIFLTRFSYPATSTSGVFGFRCVFSP
ncbi:MAG: hypothetical protein U0T83_04325 [Bacteriovoracaceae bacterium]